MHEIKVKINWKNCNRNEQIAEYFCEKVMKLLDFHFVNKNDPIKGIITYLPKKNIYQINLALSVTNMDPVYAQSEHETSVYHAINQTFDKAVDQLRRIKTKIHKN